MQGECEGIGAEFNYIDLPVIKADQTLLTLLFQNLLSNSIRYRGTDPLRVEIRATKNDRIWTICVTDNGRGFDSEAAEKIFRLFEQLPEVENTGGQGIGLATCRKIIEAHQGKIWAESTIGHGSKFCFTLPDSEV